MNPDFKLNFYTEKKNEIKSSECQYYEVWDYIFFFILPVFFNFLQKIDVCFIMQEVIPKLLRKKIIPQE